MRQYILKRLLLIPFTLWGIITVNFAIIQLAPGGPVDYVLAQYRGMNTDAKSQIIGTADIQQSSSYRHHIAEHALSLFYFFYAFRRLIRYHMHACCFPCMCSTQGFWLDYRAYRRLCDSPSACFRDLE